MTSGKPDREEHRPEQPLGRGSALSRLGADSETVFQEGIIQRGESTEGDEELII